MFYGCYNKEHVSSSLFKYYNLKANTKSRQLDLNVFSFYNSAPLWWIRDLGGMPTFRGVLSPIKGAFLWLVIAISWLKISDNNIKETDKSEKLTHLLLL